MLLSDPSRPMSDPPKMPSDPSAATKVRQRGDAFYRQGKFAEAAAEYRRALELDPSDADAHNNLGAALADLNQLDEALACYQSALRLRPDFPDAQYNLGNALTELKRFEEAAASYRAALRLRPEFVPAHINLGNALRRWGRLAESAASYRAALRLRPDSFLAWNNLGLTLADSGQFEDALAHYDQALRLNPDYAEAHRNRSLVWLLRGDWSRGWSEYEWRWQCHDMLPPKLPKPAWDGSPLNGRRLLIYTEQGLGDTLDFVRFARLVRGRGGFVILAAPERLHAILADCAGVDRLVSRERVWLDFDVHCPLLSLPLFFGITPTTIPAPVPYLRAEPDRVAHWKRELAGVRGYRVGIAWQGSPTYSYDRVRSIPLLHFAPLAAIEGVRLISLQQGAAPPGDVSAAVPRVELGDRLDESAAFVDTAAVMQNLDLVITCDSSVAHVAGALGVEVWVALSFVPDWRWLLGRDDTPWYPTMRLFRQERLDDWDGVFARIAAALRARVAGTPSLKPISVTIAPGELIDKITILEIKAERITDPDQLRNVRSELAELTDARDEGLRDLPGLAGLTADLRAVNESLWDVEDEVRRCERDRDFGPRFVELARCVYRENDRRSSIKRRINDRLGWHRQEEKQYLSGVE
jgi:Flp pilus assembly protein TadD